LEELVERGRRMPFKGGVAVDREALLNIIDQMRITIPQDLRRYKEFEVEKERYIAQAQEEARTILEQAHEDAARLLDEQSIKRQAEVDARRITERARREADEVRAGSDAYALASLQALEVQVQRLARTIQNGLSELMPAQDQESLAGAESSDEEPADAATERVPSVTAERVPDA
jgi:vacuolar-type H+-ATPase subunit H